MDKKIQKPVVVNKPGLAEWLTLNLQLILFLIPGQETSNLESIWKEITGEEHEKYEKKGSERRVNGVYRGHNLTLIENPQRLTVLIQPIPNPEFSDFDNLGTGATAINSFIDLVINWFSNSCPPITRFGFAGKLILPKDNEIIANELLNSLLPNVYIDEKCSDFIYRINRPRISKSNRDFKLNVINLWQTAKVVVARADLSEQGFSPNSPTYIKCLCSIDFDVSTPGDQTKPIQKENLNQLLKEFAHIAIESVKEGDISLS